jgi:Amt family ammonium transporter
MPYRVVWAALLAPALALAQSVPPATETRISNLEAAVKSAQSAGDNAWMLVSAALVLMMTGPGLALFYGGLVRRKNVLSTMMHSFVLMALVSVIWAIAGYSLAFSEGSPVLGGFHYLFLNNVGAAPIPTMPPPSRTRPT